MIPGMYWRDQFHQAICDAISVNLWAPPFHICQTEPPNHTRKSILACLFLSELLFFLYYRWYISPAIYRRNVSVNWPWKSWEGNRVNEFIKRTVSWMVNRVDSRFEPSQWETVLLCNDICHWLGANLESTLDKETEVPKPRQNWKDNMIYLPSNSHSQSSLVKGDPY